MQLMCHRVRECSAHCCKTNKSGVADMFRIFFSLTGIWSTWTLWWTRAHWKEMILNHQKEMLVQRVVCVICTGWLANHSLLLKSWKHVNLADQVVFSFFLNKIQLCKADHHFQWWWNCTFRVFWVLTSLMGPNWGLPICLHWEQGYLADGPPAPAASLLPWASLKFDDSPQSSQLLACIISLYHTTSENRPTLLDK